MDMEEKDNESIIQKVEKLLCEALKVECKREVRLIDFEFSFPSGRVHKAKTTKECLPAPVQEILDGFLEKYIGLSYERGYNNGYFQGYEDKDNGLEPRIDFEVPDGYND
jgi:hypothetical protein